MVKFIVTRTAYENDESLAYKNFVATVLYVVEGDTAISAICKELQHGALFSQNEIDIAYDNYRNDLNNNDEHGRLRLNVNIDQYGRPTNGLLIQFDAWALHDEEPKVRFLDVLSGIK